MNNKKLILVLSLMACVPLQGMNTTFRAITPVIRTHIPAYAMRLTASRPLVRSFSTSSSIDKNLPKERKHSVISREDMDKAKEDLRNEYEDRQSLEIATYLATVAALPEKYGYMVMGLWGAKMMVQDLKYKPSQLDILKKAQENQAQKNK